MSSFRSKSARKSFRNQSKSIKSVTSCAGHVDGMKKLIENNSSTTHPNQPKLFRQKVHSLVQLLMQNMQVSRLHIRSQTLFNEIIICAIFVSVNSIQNFFRARTYSGHPWL